MVFTVPYLATAVFVFIYQPEDRLWISQKKFALFQGIQLLIITFKFTHSHFLGWNYVLVIFMAVGAYLMILGLLLCVILSCSLFGFLYRDIEAWKVKSLVWMTWYYLWTGIIFIYLIKGTVIYFGEE